MINLPFIESDCVAADPEHDTLQEYVRALLSRQQALDALESIHHQINHLWSAVRRLLVGAGAAARASRAVRVARAAKAAQAQDNYRALEKRRQECIAALHQAEVRANAALQNVLCASARPFWESPHFPTSAGTRNRNRQQNRLPRRKLKAAFTQTC